MSSWNQPQHVVAYFSLGNEHQIETIFISTKYGFWRQNPHGTTLIRYALINSKWVRTELNSAELCALTGTKDTYGALRHLSKVYDVCGSDMFSRQMFGINKKRWDGKRWISGGPILDLSLPKGDAIRADLDIHHPNINRTMENGRWVIKKF